MTYEYKVIPAPSKGLKGKGIKGGPDRFANALQTAINVVAKEGWEYVRAETLPSEEREGLMGKTTVFQNVLVFQRPVDAPSDNLVPPVIEQEAEATKQDEAEESDASEPEEAPSDHSKTSDEADDNSEPTEFKHKNDDS